MMGLKSYTLLAAQLANKNQGRKHSAQVSKSPNIWATLESSGDIRLHFEPHHSNHQQHVGTLHPDNSLTIDIHDWHTQASCKIIEALANVYAGLRKNHIWLYGGIAVPYLEPLRFDSDRHFKAPQVVKDMQDDVRKRLSAVTVDDMPARERFMLELGTYTTTPAVSFRIKNYALGKADKSVLTARDINTIRMRGDRILTHCLETLL